MIEEREDLKSLSAYTVPEASVAVELDSNESPWNIPEAIVEDIRRALTGFEFNRYPDMNAALLREALARLYGLNRENVLVGNGSNEVILNLLLAFGGPKRSAVTFEPTYTMHPIISRISGTHNVDLKLKADFSIDATQAVKHIRERRPSIIFVTSPNNPTGNSTSREVIARLLEAGDALVVADEAYGEFASVSSVDMIGSYPNLVVVKTFSKAFRMASLRVGFALAGEAVLEAVTKVKMPYNLNAFSQLAAARLIERRELLREGIDAIIHERERVYNELKGMKGIRAYPSEANFILFKTEIEANEVFEDLLAEGVLVRNFSHKKGLANCLRVTIGTAEQNDEFLAALKEALD